VCDEFVVKTETIMKTLLLSTQWQCPEQVY